MNIGIALEIDSAIRHLSVAVNRVEHKLSNCFGGRDYGKDVEHISIGLIMVRPESNRNHPVRPFKYKKKIKFRDIATNDVIELRNVIEYDIAPAYDCVSRLGVDLAEVHISELIVRSVDTFHDHHRRFPDFDIERFRQDLVECLTFQTH